MALRLNPGNGIPNFRKFIRMNVGKIHHLRYFIIGYIKTEQAIIMIKSLVNHKIPAAGEMITGYL